MGRRSKERKWSVGIEAEVITGDSPGVLLSTKLHKTCIAVRTANVLQPTTATTTSDNGAAAHLLNPMAVSP